MTMSRGLEMLAMNTGWVSKIFNFHYLCIFTVYVRLRRDSVRELVLGSFYCLLDSGARKVYVKV